MREKIRFLAHRPQVLDGLRTREPAESLETKRQGTRSWTRPRLTAVRFLGDPTLVSADVIPRGSSSLSFSLSRTAYQGSGNLKFTKREKTYSCCIILITFPWAAAGFPLSLSRPTRGPMKEKKIRSSRVESVAPEIAPEKIEEQAISVLPFALPFGLTAHH